MQLTCSDIYSTQVQVLDKALFLHELQRTQEMILNNEQKVPSTIQTSYNTENGLYRLKNATLVCIIILNPTIQYCRVN